MNVAFIPVRGGSKSIPLKNIKEINGYPLVYWTIKATVECSVIDKVYVATDSNIIRNIVNDFGFKKIEVIGRSAESASDTASTEFAMLEFAERYEFDNIFLVQATSPLLRTNDLDNGFAAFTKPGTDSVLSAVRQKRFNWMVDDNGFAKPVNYNVYARPRRQEFEGYLVENGAFYITSKKNLIKYKNRVSGNIRTVEMREDSFFEIDEPSDWMIVEALMKKQQGNTTKHIPKIKYFLTDSDGCLTDGGMYYTESGDEIKKYNSKDGMGFQLLRERGIKTGIITGEDRELVKRRGEKLQLDVIEMGIKDKLTVIKNLCEQHDVALENVAYVGDDINDIDVIQAVGFGCAVHNAVESVKAVAKYITTLDGGDGAVREVIDYILKNE